MSEVKSYPFLHPMRAPSCKVVGREKEIEDLLDILYKSRMRNVCIIGEAGVGKSELVREVARLAKKLGVGGSAGGGAAGGAGVRFYELNLANLVGDTAYRGELEEKFDEAFRALSKSSVPCVVFCDEAHMLVHAGETSGAKESLTVGNLIKPYIDGVGAGGAGAMGLSLWAATTPTEWEESIAKDHALSRRLPTYRLKELGIEEKKKILTNFARRALGDGAGTAVSEVGCEKKGTEVGIWSLINKYIDGLVWCAGGVASLDQSLEKLDMSIAHFVRTGEWAGR